MTTIRPRGGRRPEDFPDARMRDSLVLAALRRGGRMSRNTLADRLQEDPKRIRYALNRLRSRGLVVHINKGNEGHGYWAVATKETETDGS